MSEILLSTLVAQLSMQRRAELMIKGDTRAVLPLVKEMLGVMVAMAKKSNGPTQASVADLMRDTADVIERPLLQAARK